jgi:integrase
MAAITPKTLRELKPGKRLWDRGVGVYKARDGSLSWLIRYYAELPDGTRFRVEEIVEDAINRKQANDVRIARLSEVFRGVWRPREKQHAVTLADFVDAETGDFTKAKKAQKMRSLAAYESDLRLHILPFFGRSATLGSITPQQCKAFYEKRLSEDAVATANNELNCLKSVFSEAIAQGLALTNPALAVQMKRANNFRKRRISATEVAQLFRAANELPWRMGRMLFWVLYWTGMRIEEGQALERAELDMAHGLIDLRDSKTARPRTIPILPELRAELEAWLKSGAGEVYVFPGKLTHDENGKPLPEKPVSNTPVRKYWKALLLQSAKNDCEPALPSVTDLTPHDLRHHFAKLLIDRGVEPRMVMAIMGWTSWQMLQRYVLPDDLEVREAVISAIGKPSRAPATPPKIRDAG